MEYRVSPAIHARSLNTLLKMKARMFLSAGNEFLTPGMTQFKFRVYIKFNGVTASFENIGNFMESFLNSEFYNSWTNCIYEQTKTGFIVVFSNHGPYRDELGNQARRQIQSIDVGVDITDENEFHDSYDEILRLCDYGFKTVFKTFETVAPAVSSSKCQNIFQLKRLVAPIQRALDLNNEASANKIRIIAESGVIPNNDKLFMKSLQWENLGYYFKPMEYTSRKFIILDDGDGSENVHVPCFLNPGVI